jgi:hypothetical protein
MNWPVAASSASLMAPGACGSLLSLQAIVISRSAIIRRDLRHGTAPHGGLAIAPHTRMRRYNKPNKTRQEWEEEMLKCLEEAKARVSSASADDTLSALQHYQEVLRQFMALTNEGKIPTQSPCYS